MRVPRAVIEPALALVGAVAIDRAAPFPFVASPLYAVPILLAARSDQPYAVVLTSVVAIAASALHTVLSGRSVTLGILSVLCLAPVGYLAHDAARRRLDAQRQAGSPMQPGTRWPPSPRWSPTTSRGLRAR